MTPIEAKTKAHIYATRRGCLLVFSHVEHPEVGYQIPGGTVEPQEGPIDAAKREFMEETGLDISVTGLRLLGTYKYDMRPFRDEIQERHVFHVELGSIDLPEWQHSESHPHSRGTCGPEVFEFQIGRASCRERV